jgi:hypothetical protein
MSTTSIVFALSIVLAAAGFLLPLWPLSLVGVAIAGLAGRWAFALMLGLLLDIAFGAPVGQWHLLYFPFVFFALVLTMVRYFSSTYIRKSSYDTL